MGAIGIRRRFGRTLATGLSLALSATFVVAGQTSALADSAPTPPEPTTVTNDALPTVQVDGVVWSQVVIGNTVYVGGDFQTARPAGSPPGVNTVPRKYLLAYDIRTGALIDSFAPTLNASVQGLSSSPDGSRLYVAGDFTSISGTSRYRLAAFNTSDGSLVNNFKPILDYRARTVVATDNTVYVGGAFSNSSGIARPKLAAFAASNGALTNWAPVAAGGQQQVMAMVMSADKTKLIVGGQFTTLNGQDAYGLGALDATTGATVPFAANQLIRNAGTRAGITSLSTANGKVYGSGYVFGSEAGFTKGNLEGVFAADSNTGDIQWIEDCHGDTYNVFGGNGVVYSVGHPHHCDNVRSYQQSNPEWFFRRATAFTDTAQQTLLHNNYAGYYDFGGRPGAKQLSWYPDLEAGAFTGQNQAAWSLAGNSDYLVVGGEFPRVNGKPQQGLVRFARAGVAPNADGPRITGADFVPTLFRDGTGTVTGMIKANFDNDNENLTYRVYREGSPTPVATQTVKSTFYHRPTFSFIDNAADPSQAYRYRVQVQDPFGNTVTGDYVDVGIGATQSSLGAYGQGVLTDDAYRYWRLSEPSGAVVKDWAGNADMVASSGVSRGTAGPILGDLDTASTFVGNSNGKVSPLSTNQRLAGLQEFSTEAWIKTTTTQGGKIIGYGNSVNATSTSYDRHVYMQNNGKLTFGVNQGGSSQRTVSSSASYNNGEWHHVVATLSANGMQLYVDGELVGDDPNTTYGQSYDGYWRIGGDNLDGWPNAPLSRYFAGAIDDVAVYRTPLTAAQISSHWALSGHETPLPDEPPPNVPPPNVPPTAQFGSQVTDLTTAFDASASTDTDGTITSYAWNFGDSTNGSGVTTSHTYPAAGTYTVTLTVTDNNNAATSVSHDVTVTSADPSVLARDSFERTVSNLWGVAEEGGTWAGSGTAASYSTSGGKALVSVPAGQNRVLDLSGVSSSATDTTLNFTLPRPIGSSAYISLIGRRVDASNDYRLKMRVYDNGDVTAQLVRAVGKVETTIGGVKVPGLVFNDGDTLQVRLQVSGTAPTTLNAKVWKSGTAEPGAWTVSTTDSTAGLQIAGSLGLVVYIAGTVTNAPMSVAFDDLLSVKFP